MRVIITGILKVNKKLLIFSAILAIATIIALYYLLMPAWIIVVREGEDENASPSIENRFRIAQSDLAEYPKLEEAIALADGNYLYVSWVPPVKAWYWEGMKIVERFDMDSQYPPEYDAFLIYNDNNNVKKVYLVSVVFGYEQPVQM